MIRAARCLLPTSSWPKLRVTLGFLLVSLNSPTWSSAAGVRLLGDLDPGFAVSPPYVSAVYDLPDGRLIADVSIDPAAGDEPVIVSPDGSFELLDDFCPGTCSSIPYTSSWVRDVGSWRVLSLQEGGESHAWLTRGDRASTHELPDFLLGSSCNYGLGEIPGALLFARYQADTGCEPWAWDLTTHEWRLLLDARPGTDSSSPWVLAPSVSNRVAVSMLVGSVSRAVWLLGASREASVEIIASGPSTPAYGEFFANSGRWIFSGPGERSTKGALWSTDGTVAGTRRVLDDPAVEFPSPLGALGSSKLIVSAVVGGKRQLLRFGSTMVALTRFTEPAALDLYVPSVVVGDRALAFVARDGAHGSELWWTDGTKAGTKMARDLCPGACSSGPTSLRALGERAIFVAGSPQKGREVWSAAPGKAPALVLDNCAGPCSGAPTSLVVAGGYGVFETSDVLRGDLTWLTDGAPRSAQAIEGYQDTGNVAAGNQVYLLAEPDDGSGRRLLHVSGWPAALREVELPWRAGPRSSRPESLLSAGNGVYFAARESGHGREPWYADGAGARRLGEVAYGHGGLDSYGDPARVALDTGVLFAHRNATHFAARAGGIQRLTTECVPNRPVARGAKAFFECDRHLAVTDGTVAGTSELPQIDTSSASNYNDRVGVPWGSGDLAVIGRNEDWVLGVYVTDGTAAGTRRLSMTPRDPRYLVASTQLFLVDGSYDSRLLVSDGAAASPTVEVDFPPDTQLELGFAHPRGFGLLSDGGEYWSNDGTAAGWIHHGRWRDESTRYYHLAVTVAGGRVLLYDTSGSGPFVEFDSVTGSFEPIEVDGNPYGKVVKAGERAFFLAADDGEGSRHLYRTSLSGNGLETLWTGAIQDFAPTADGKHVYLSVTDATVGQELFVWDE
jgi:ELWxxDGT repeat protein